MNNVRRLSLYCLGLIAGMCCICHTAQAQTLSHVATNTDSLVKSIVTTLSDSTFTQDEMDKSLDEIVSKTKPRAQKKRQEVVSSHVQWTPDPKRAVWLGLVIPGAGQIYNRKYWKLPIVYGGFVGCIYAMQWNDMLYKDYSQAYIDLVDNDPNTQSYNQFLHLGSTITEANAERYKTIFKSRKDRYRRWRDLSFFCLIGVYALSVIDAYVDATLSQFDISDDLSMKIAPVIIPQDRNFLATRSASMGIQCSIEF